jgi:hypothetical protein
MMRALANDASMRFVAHNYADERPEIVDVGHRRGNVAHSGGTRRVVADRYILWLRALDSDSGRVVLTHRRPTTLDDPDEWAKPLHEALKRLRGRSRPYAPGYRWLIQVIQWRGQPCWDTASAATDAYLRGIGAIAYRSGPDAAEAEELGAACQLISAACLIEERAACQCADIVHHIATIERTDPAEVDALRARGRAPRCS